MRIPAPSEKATSITQAVSRDRIFPEKKEKLTVCLASTIGHYEDAFRVAYQVYHPLGFVPHTPSGMCISESKLKKSTVVFVAYLGGRPVGTMSVYRDTGGGLPSDAGWKTELNHFRDKGRVLVEFGSLMVLRDLRKGISVCLELFRHAWIYTTNICRCDTICGFIQKRHERFYRNILQFIPFSEPRFYRWNGLQIKGVMGVSMDPQKAREHFKKQECGAEGAPLNLYRYFCVTGFHKTRLNIWRQLAEQKRLSRKSFLRKFKPLLHAETTAGEKTAQLRKEAAQS